MASPNEDPKHSPGSNSHRHGVSSVLSGILHPSPELKPMPSGSGQLQPAAVHVVGSATPDAGQPVHGDSPMRNALAFLKRNKPKSENSIESAPAALENRTPPRRGRVSFDSTPSLREMQSYALEHLGRIPATVAGTLQPTAEKAAEATRKWLSGTGNNEIPTSQENQPALAVDEATRQRRNQRSQRRKHRPRPVPFIPQDPYRVTLSTLSPIPPFQQFFGWLYEWVEEKLGLDDDATDSTSRHSSAGSHKSAHGIKKPSTDETIPLHIRKPHGDTESLPEHALPIVPASSPIALGPPTASPAMHPASEPISPNHRTVGMFPIDIPPIRKEVTEDIETLGVYSKEIVRQLYRHILLRLPSLYFNRVGRVFQEARISKQEVDALILRSATGGPESWELDRSIKHHEDSDTYLGTTASPSPALRTVNLPGDSDREDHPRHQQDPLWRFKAEWEAFIESLIKEWKTLNVVSALLISALLTIFQIEEASNEPITRTSALLSLVCALMSLLFGGIYILRFSTMRTMRKAARWANEAKRDTSSIFWNIWVLLSLPVTYLAYSMVFFIISILAFVWTSGNGKHVDPLDKSNTSGVILGPRIVITLTFITGLVYFVLVLKTFRSWTGTKILDVEAGTTDPDSNPPKIGDPPDMGRIPEISMLLTTPPPTSPQKLGDGLAALEALNKSRDTRAIRNAAIERSLGGIPEDRVDVPANTSVNAIGIDLGNQAVPSEPASWKKPAINDQTKTVPTGPQKPVDLMDDQSPMEPAGWEFPRSEPIDPTMLHDGTRPYPAEADWWSTNLDQPWMTITRERPDGSGPDIVGGSGVILDESVGKRN